MFCNEYLDIKKAKTKCLSHCLDTGLFIVPVLPLHARYMHLDVRILLGNVLLCALYMYLRESGQPQAVKARRRAWT